MPNTSSRLDGASILDSVLDVSEFMLIEYGTKPVPEALVVEVEHISSMLNEFGLDDLRAYWRRYASNGPSCEEDRFIVRCASYFRAIDPKFRQAYGKGLQEMADEIFLEKRPT
jgi:hypothetical protein